MITFYNILRLLLITMIQSVLFWGLCVQFLLPVRIIATQSSRKANILVHLTRCTTLTGEDLGYYEQFLGIPYAQPPVGDLRFNVGIIQYHFKLNINLRFFIFPIGPLTSSFMDWKSSCSEKDPSLFAVL